MSEPARALLRAGAEAGMVEDFRALADATAPNGLPRVIVAHEGLTISP